eukprot:scaffold9147_cov52-Phaeocystis_antarctica.AAC.1
MSSSASWVSAPRPRRSYCCCSTAAGSRLTAARREVWRGTASALSLHVRRRGQRQRLRDDQGRAQGRVSRDLLVTL